MVDANRPGADRIGEDPDHLGGYCGETRAFTDVRREQSEEARPDDQTHSTLIMFGMSKREFLTILAVLLIGIAGAVEITYYLAQRYLAAQHADDPLERAGGLKPGQAVDKK